MHSPHDSAASDDLRWRIQQEAKELSMAHQGLSSWIGEIETAKNRDCVLSANTRLDSSERTNRGEVTRPDSSSNKCISKPAYNTTCEEERMYGNKCFSEGKYSDAIESYTRCLRYKEALTSAVVYSNRGMLCRENLSKQDCLLLSQFSLTLSNLLIKTSIQQWHI